LKATAYERIEAAVTAGRISQPHANALKQRIEQGGGVPFLGHRFGAAASAGMASRPNT
jgi:hypothetical protein